MVLLHRPRLRTSPRSTVHLAWWPAMFFSPPPRTTNWRTKIRENKTNRGYKRYRTIIDENVIKLLKARELQKSYNKWITAIAVLRTRTKKTRKDIKNLQEIHKRLRLEYSATIEKILILERTKILKGSVTEKYKEAKSKSINQIAQKYISICWQ